MYKGGLRLVLELKLTNETKTLEISGAVYGTPFLDRRPKSFCPRVFVWGGWTRNRQVLVQRSRFSGGPKEKNGRKINYILIEESRAIVMGPSITVRTSIEWSTYALAIQILLNFKMRRSAELIVRSVVHFVSN